MPCHMTPKSTGLLILRGSLSLASLRSLDPRIREYGLFCRQLVLTFASDWLKVWCGFSSLIVKLSEGKTIQSQSSLNFLKIALFWLVLISDW